ncbi:MAG TPA: hypothetical protein DDW52_17750 [Planctomycetaceae bacterium]|nr:hypothetical protein [Planctomycetaceae bacterium]
MTQSSPKQWFQLEEQFFGRVNQDLLAKLRASQEKAAAAEAIMQVTGITDAELAADIASKEVTVETLSAFRLVPLVSVAWADDRIESDEREVILEAAAQSGISKEDPAMGLLESWTKQRPSSQLLDTWCEYAAALSASLEESHRSKLRDEVLSQARAVAEACGGILGFGSISPGEEATLEKIQAAFGA